MSDHLAVLEELAKKWRHEANEIRMKWGYDERACASADATELAASELEAATALMRGQSEVVEAIRSGPRHSAGCATNAVWSGNRDCDCDAGLRRRLVERGWIPPADLFKQERDDA